VSIIWLASMPTIPLLNSEYSLQTIMLAVIHWRWQMTIIHSHIRILTCFITGYCLTSRKHKLVIFVTGYWGREISWWGSGMRTRINAHILFTYILTNKVYKNTSRYTMATTDYLINMTDMTFLIIMCAPLTYKARSDNRVT